MTVEFLKTILTEELFGCKVCESTNDAQIVNYFYNRFLLEKLLYGEPVSVPELRKLLRKKIVNFEFIKLDGNVRPAQGTTMMKYIPPSDHPKGIRPSSDKVATFFDLDKDAWRSVSRRSKELVLKKDEKTDKPIIVVKDKSKVKVKVISKERVSDEEIEQGKTYKYTTNRGTNTHVEIVRVLNNGLFQVSSPLFKTTFAIDPAKIGDEFIPEDPDVTPTEPDVTPEDQSEIKNKPIVKPIEKEKETNTNVNVSNVKPVEKNKYTEEPAEEPKPSVEIKDIKPVHPIKKPNQFQQPDQQQHQTDLEPTVILPTEIEQDNKGEAKAPPIDITPPPDTEESEELSR